MLLAIMGRIVEEEMVAIEIICDIELLRVFE